MGTRTPSVRGQAKGLYRAATMLCPRLDISTVAWHTLALARGHRPRLPALSSLHQGVQVFVWNSGSCCNPHVRVTIRVCTGHSPGLPDNLLLALISAPHQAWLQGLLTPVCSSHQTFGVWQDAQSLTGRSHIASKRCCGRGTALVSVICLSSFYPTIR